MGTRLPRETSLKLDDQMTYRVPNRIRVAAAACRTVAAAGLVTFASGALAATLTNIGQIRALSSDPINNTNTAVILEAVVTHVSLHRPEFWIQDSSGGAPVSGTNRPSGLARGQRVRISGKLNPPGQAAWVEAQEVQILGSGTIPPAALRTVAQLNTFADENRLVQAEGRVVGVRERDRRWLLDMECEGVPFSFEIVKGTNQSLPPLQDGQVRAVGVCVKHIYNAGEVLRPRLLVQSLEDLTVLRLGTSNRVHRHSDFHTLPIVSIASISPDSSDLTVVRLQGIVLDQRLGEYVVIRDASGTIRAETRLARVMDAHERVDVWGEIALDEQGDVFLRNAEVRLIGTNLTSMATSPATNRPPELPLLTRLRQIRDLTPEQASWAYPVRVRAVVTVFSSSRKRFFVQEETGGIEVLVARNLPELETGNLVEISGQTSAGATVAAIDPTQVKILGQGTLSQPIQANLLQLVTGNYEAQWIEFKGVVRSTTFENGLAQLKLNDTHGTLLVNLLASTMPEHLVGAVVRVRGTVKARYDDSQQIARLGLWCPSLDYITVVQPGTTDPLADLPPSAIELVRKLPANESLQQRVKILGVVTLVKRSDSLFVEDASGAAIEVFASQAHTLKPGDRVVVAGYPALGDCGGVLRDAIFRVIGRATLADPETITPERPLNPAFHGRRVGLEAVLLSFSRVNNSQVLMLQFSNHVIQAHCLLPADQVQLPRPGSRLHLHGIYQVITGESRLPSSFQLLLDSSADIRVIAHPQWWNMKRSMFVIGTLLFLVALTILWVALLRRRVEEQTRQIRERFEREAALEQQYRGIFEGANDLIFVHDTTGRITSINPAALRVLGYRSEEARQLTIRQLIAPESHNGSDTTLFGKSNGDANSAATNYECELIAKDGRRVRVEISTRTAMRNGVSVGTQAIARDITERKRAEAALAQTSELMNTLLEYSRDHIYFKDHRSRITHASKSLAEIFRLSPAQMRGKTDFDLFHKDHAQPAFEDEQRILETGAPLLGKLEKEILPDGRVSWVLTDKGPWRDKNGDIIGTFGISKNITAIREAEIKLEYERELFRALLDNVPDGIYFKDRQCRFVQVSRSTARRLLDITMAQFRKEHPEPAALPEHLSDAETFGCYLVGKTECEVDPRETARQAAHDEQQIMRTGEPIIGKLEQTQLPEGALQWSLTTKMPWRNRDGEIIGTFGVSRDITELKQAEEKLDAAHQRLVQTSRLAGMAEVATDVLHNVGNVLNSVNVSCSVVVNRIRTSKLGALAKVSGLLEQQRNRLPEFLTTDPQGRNLPQYLNALSEYFTDEQRAMLAELEQLRGNIDHIKQVVAMQQNYAKVAGVIENVCIASLVEDALRINSAGLTRHDVQVRCEFEEISPIATDKHRVLQVLVNLINNAKYALNDLAAEQRVIRIRTSNHPDHVRIQIIDNGMGIAPENITRIFQHGFTTRRNGHGFGLHSGALAARELGGSLQAHSDGHGKGATFTLVLPHKSRLDS